MVFVTMPGCNVVLEIEFMALHAGQALHHCTKLQLSFTFYFETKSHQVSFEFSV